jgi:uncharacterized protein (TIGR00369 family)
VAAAVRTFEPRDPDWDRKVRESFARQPFTQLVGFQISDLQPGRMELTLPMRAELTQQHGFAHGGVLATLADIASAYAGFSLMPPDSAPLTVEFKLNLLAPGKGDSLIARGEVLKPGKTLTVCETRIFAIDEGQETLIGTALVTMMCLMGMKD